MYNIDMNGSLDQHEILKKLRSMLPLLREKYHVGTLESLARMCEGKQEVAATWICW